MSTRGLLVSLSWHYKNPIQRVGLEQSGPHHHLILTCSHHDIAEKLLSWRYVVPGFGVILKTKTKIVQVVILSLFPKFWSASHTQFYIQ
jgi:hypothetical protein